MKIIITSQEPNLDSLVDPRFGRCQYFLVLDTETMEWEAKPNPAINAAGGAGTQAAQFAAAQGADGVISGDFGPNTFSALAAVDIGMYRVPADTTVRDAVAAFKKGELTRVDHSIGPAMPGGRGRG